MLIKLGLGDLEQGNLLVKTSKRESVADMYVSCTGQDLGQTLEALKGYKKVKGCLCYLSSDTDLPLLLLGQQENTGVAVYLVYELSELESAHLSATGELPLQVETLLNGGGFVRLTIKTLPDFHNMRVVYKLSRLHGKKIAFCGGEFINLQGCNFGCVDGTFFKKDSLTSTEETCSFKALGLVDYRFSLEAEPVKAERTQKPAKQKVTLSFANKQGFSAF